MAYAPRELWDQTGHPLSLIRALTVGTEAVQSLSFIFAHAEDSGQAGRISRLTRVLAGRTYHFFVLHKVRIKLINKYELSDNESE